MSYVLFFQNLITEQKNLLLNGVEESENIGEFVNEGDDDKGELQFFVW